MPAAARADEGSICAANAALAVVRSAAECAYDSLIRAALAARTAADRAANAARMGNPQAL